MTTRPAPRHVLHGLAIILPLPRHCGHVRATVKKPCCERTCPAPRQRLHTIGCVPGAAPLPLIKLGFNLAVLGVQASMGAFVFHAIVGARPGLGPREWLAA